jgi:hypothetical protein
MIDIIRLDPYGLDERDKLDLIKFSKADYNKRSAADFIEATIKELFQLWRLSEGEDRGILITKVIATARGGRTLYIEGMAGVGFVKRPKELAELLFNLAKQGGCNSVTGWVQRPGMERMLREMELPIVASVFMKEVPNAPQELA